MSDAQLLAFLQLIYGQLCKGINKVETALPEEFKISGGGSNIFFDPKWTDYPILHDLYQLRSDIGEGMNQLEREKEVAK